jgi:hypothetical protein
MAVMTITGDLLLGLALGKLVADALFYAPTVVAFELRTILCHSTKIASS